MAQKKAPAVDFAAEGLLDGVDDQRARAGRLDLLEQLHADGFDLDELRRAVAEDRLALLPVERALGGEGEYTAAEIAERSGLGADLLARIRVAQGLPLPSADERGFDEQDLEAARRVAALKDAGLSEEGLLDVTRVLGRAMSRVAASVRTFVADELIDPSADEREVGERLVGAVEGLVPMTGPLLSYMFEEHLRDQLRSDVIAHNPIATGDQTGTQQVTVCFADLVGFTKLGESVPADELGGIAERLGRLASDAVRPPVKLMKMIGDAAMLVSPAPEPLLDSALELVARADAEGNDFPQLRAGIAHGEAAFRWGEWYGSPVNVASRVTGVARPGSVLATEAARHEAEHGPYRWSFAGRRRLRGLRGEVALYRVRPAAAETGADA